MISLLLPVRRDSTLLEGFISNFLDATADLDNVELCVSISNNEKFNLPLLKKYAGFEWLKVVKNDKSLGRWGLHEYMNSLAKISTGDLLWHMCDDYRVYKDYDVVLKEYEKYSDKVWCLLPCPRQENKISGFVAPIITRKWVEITKHWAKGYSVDCWIGEIIASYLTDRVIHIPNLDLKDLTYTDPSLTGVERVDGDANPNKIKTYLDTRFWECLDIRQEIKKDADKLRMEIK